MSIFCGVGDIPKGKKRGSMKDCMEAGQIRYYGVKQIDSRLVKNMLNLKESKKIGSKKEYKKGSKKAIKAEKDKLTVEIATIGGKIKNIKDRLAEETSKFRIAKLNEELAELRNQKQKLLEKVGNLKNQSRATIKKGSKKGSKKGYKKSSKKGSKKVDK